MANFSAGDNVTQFDKGERPLNSARDAQRSHTAGFAVCPACVIFLSITEHFLLWIGNLLAFMSSWFSHNMPFLHHF